MEQNEFYNYLTNWFATQINFFIQHFYHQKYNKERVCGEWVLLMNLPTDEIKTQMNRTNI